MKRLILVRHAKSSWSDSNLPDKDRPLNERGIAAAPKIGKWLADNGYQPDQVVASDAVRCRQTWAGISTELADVANVAFVPFLYLATDQEMLEVMQTAEGDTVLLIGHMPGIGDFARELRRDPPPLHDMFRRYPTGAATALEFRIDEWPEIQFGTGVHLDYATPKDL